MFLRISAFLLAFTAILHADELTKSVQSTLKEQGFFYGEINGINGPETSAAVKRYQIRNGLEVTGTFTKQTLDALGLGSDSASAPALPPPPPAPEPEPELAPAPPPAPAPPVQREARTPNHLRKDDSVQQSDRDFLNRQVPQPQIDPAEADDPVPPPRGGSLAHVFGQTPYASAPLEVQQATVKQAQRFLQKLDMYDGEIDGIPGPLFEEGLLQYQRFIRLPLTGQLDLETLAAMRLLPGRGGFPARVDKPQIRRVPGQPLRGVLID